MKNVCSFCKVEPKEQLKSCVCRKASYCFKECQTKDWKSHKSSCRPFKIKEAPDGKGKGLFATRSITEGEVILEETPLHTEPQHKITSFFEFKKNVFPNLRPEAKAKILQLHDPSKEFKSLEGRKKKKLIKTDPNFRHYRDGGEDEVDKMYRIVCHNSLQCCQYAELCP